MDDEQQLTQGDKETKDAKPIVFGTWLGDTWLPEEINGCRIRCYRMHEYTLMNRLGSVGAHAWQQRWDGECVAAWIHRRRSASRPRQHRYSPLGRWFGDRWSSDDDDVATESAGVRRAPAEIRLMVRKGILPIMDEGFRVVEYTDEELGFGLEASAILIARKPPDD